MLLLFVLMPPVFSHKYGYDLYIFRTKDAFNVCNFTQATLLTKPNSTSFTVYIYIINIYIYTHIAFSHSHFLDSLQIVKIFWLIAWKGVNFKWVSLKFHKGLIFTSLLLLSVLEIDKERPSFTCFMSDHLFFRHWFNSFSGLILNNRT